MAGRGGIRLYITADSKGLNRGLNQAQSSVDRFAKGAGRLSRLGGGGLAGVVGGLTSLGGAAALLKESTTATMDLYKATRRLSTITGMDMQTSNAWINTAQSRGIKTDQLVRSYTTLAKQIGLAQRGGKTAVATFQQLGVSQETLRTGNTAEIMAKVSDGFTRYADGLGKSRVASQLFGRSYAPMLALLNKGSGNLKELLRDELKHGGQLTLSQKQYERARQAQIRFNMSMEKLKVTIGNSVLPFVTKLANKMSDWLQKGANRQKIEQVVHSFARMATQIGNVLEELAPVVRSIGRFVAKNPGIVKMIGYMVALRVAVKLISFVNPLRGVTQLIGRVRYLRTAGVRGGRGMVNGITSALNWVKPKIASWLAALAIRFGAAGSASGSAFGGGFIASMLAKLGPIAGILKWGARIGGPGAFLTTFFTHGVNDITPDRNVRDMVGIRGSGTVKFLPQASSAQMAALRGSSGIPSMSMPQLTMPAGEPTQNTGDGASGGRRGARRAGAPKVSPRAALHRAYRLRNWAHPFKVRLARIGSRDTSLAANRRRKSILEQGIAKWRSVRSELKRLASDAHKGGDERVTSMIWDLIHRGDELAARWKTELGAVKDVIAVEGSQEAIDNANRKLEVARSTIAAEQAFLKTAFGFGDIGSGGMNAWTAAGGAMGLSAAGGNVNIMINSLHPGDAKTKAAIGKAVVGAVGNQGSRKRPRQTVGGRR
ncbi:MAG: hypothetical protein WCO96_01220 [Actinomycetes bacterium]